MKKHEILVIVGPTASGKSDLAVKLAKSLNGEIISADSRQVYKGLDIGTGKITKREMKNIPHYLLSVANPKERFTVAEWKSMALKTIEFIRRRGKLPIIVGGTGFYIDSLWSDLPNVPPNKTLRKKLNKESTETLFAMLKKKDPKRAKTIDKHNKVRLVRALEIVAVLGKVPKAKSRKLIAASIWIGLKPNNLDKRIHARLIRRIPGIIRETKKLSKKRAHELGLEYRFAFDYLEKKLSRKEFIEQLETAIRQYSKRQMTWFKRNEKIRWFGSSSSAFRATIRKRLG